MFYGNLPAVNETFLHVNNYTECLMRKKFYELLLKQVFKHFYINYQPKMNKNKFSKTMRNHFSRSFMC